MTYRVNDNVTIAIYIEGVELMLDNGNALHLLHIVGGSLITLPTLHFRFTDLLRLVPSMNLQDGSKIQVTINSTVSIDRYFRVYSWSRAPAGDGFSYVVDAYWDAPKFWLGTTQASLNGSSYDVLSNIAKDCSLQFYTDNTKTSDTMIWSPGNVTFGQFARDIARHGYVNDKSHMVMGVDTTGYLRYIDINGNPPPKMTVGYTPSENDVNFSVLSDFKPTSKSGIHNTLVGYRHTRYPQAALAASQNDESGAILELRLDSDATKPVLNQKVRDLQTRGMVSFAPINFGNVHSKYERAKYQNTRYSMLNSVKGEFLFTYQTPWETCDNFKYVSPAELNNTTYDGEFTIATKVVYITGATYQEKVIAYRNGLST